MGKTKVGKYNKGQEVPKQQLLGTKDCSVKKNKNLKCMTTPMGKVTLISSKVQDKPSQKSPQKSFAIAKIQNRNLTKQTAKNNAISNHSKQVSPNREQYSSSGKVQNDSFNEFPNLRYI